MDKHFNIRPHPDRSIDCPACADMPPYWDRCDHCDGTGTVDRDREDAIRLQLDAEDAEVMVE